jgi:exodeoxyribonuclease-1
MTFYWYDYETLGPNPRRDCPAQFAGLRTDEELNIIGEPLVLYCRPTPDYIPVPESCLVHGISPMELLEKGALPAEFAAAIHAELSVPNTCSVGYNAISFDHEITRFLFYRNLLDPYTWHYKEGCSRWDVIDLLRAAYALRPDGIRWPRREDGAPSFRLEDIARANGILQESAHDALSDVLTTIAVAALVKKGQPNLFDYYLGLRVADNVRPFLERPSLFVSGLVSAADGCATIIAPVCEHPKRGHGAIVYDLRKDPEPFIGLSSDQLRQLIFSRRDELPDGVERPPLYRIRANTSPFLADPKLVDQDVQQRLGFDLEQCRENYKKLSRMLPSMASNISRAYDRDWASSDADEALYDGFFPDSDRDLLNQLLAEGSLNAKHSLPVFEDERLPELVFRYHARNHAKTLLPESTARWAAHCRTRHLSPDENGHTRLDRYDAAIEDLRIEREGDESAHAMLDQLALYGTYIRRWLT